MNTGNAIRRLSDLISMMCYEGYRFSVSRAASDLDIEIGVIRQDLRMLMKNPVFSERITFDDGEVNVFSISKALTVSPIPS